ncbi:ABC transporter ATP-binding protein [Porphyromonas levii]|uniref:ATP-binding cassette domain-containing protein n=1 Tax=Porphyromonas levii TaxID=28114 RepID=A0A4Y8WN41_9PORP|nr:ATP-binding cassette domain-containing protein [Porphyromonas levii]MBR8702543.1 putative iron export ATP-binding protein FetA [Porphyromonas levii]MBR8713136.1 putative iron export ATP-binding protein FetA [Porphyromonas levii]MBR8714669.1 putative iron export ATP-binding protein FetA [Porphyromonas levii]MBR8727667.1 putative iron export ATP-binding protein FetA [Porphyromonas levii]MBR8731799.1 putative iron export ATP-binding protein FetA [Porphyromonas levii]
MIEFSNATFRFGDKLVIDRFTDLIETGEHVAITGESGAGKSTLLNSIVGLAIPREGSIVVDGLAVVPEHIRKIRTLVGWLPQEVQLPYDTVLEMLQAPYKYKANRQQKFDRQRYEEAVERLGLPTTILGKPMQKISGGERQRMLIISALLQGRKILLMDEPTSALDHTNTQRFIEYLSQLHDTTIVTVTHDTQLAESMHRQITLNKL